MICFMCKGSMQNGISNFTADLGKCIIIVKNVPSQICNQCGEVSFNDDTAKRLEDIVHTLTEPVSAEIAVVSYTEKAA
ncbi:MAG: type II toxin-antitoxin system MqsA family antitoxin [Treponema sp.]|nr:type II toxin-antitoxin system MqsA family antitoxin [Treponema sp.]